MTGVLSNKYAGWIFFLLLFFVVIILFATLCVLAEQKTGRWDELKRSRPFKNVKVEDDHALAVGMICLFLSGLFFLRFDFNVPVSLFCGLVSGGFLFYIFGWFYWGCERIVIWLVERKAVKTGTKK